MSMTRAQQRAVALSCARYQLCQLKVNPLEVSAADAHTALEDYVPRYPEMVGAHWYRTATDDEITGFYHAWARWQRQQRRLLLLRIIRSSSVTYKAWREPFILAGWR